MVYLASSKGWLANWPCDRPCWNLEWSVGQKTGNFRERHAHHGCTSLVSRSEAFTTSDLLVTVGALLGGSAREIRTAQICFSLNNNPCPLPADSSYRGWLASVLSASKAKIPSPPARKLEPHFIVLYFASWSTALPSASYRLRRRSRVLRTATSVMAID
jgi:hypothetical protein